MEKIVMNTTKIGTSLFKQYAWSCNKKFVIQALPKKISGIKPNSLKYVSKLESDILEIRTPAVQVKKYVSDAEPFPQAGGCGCPVYKKDGSLLGKCSYEDSIIYSSCDNHIYPASWIDSVTHIPKSSLYVNYISIPYLQRGKGNGREIIKRLYLQSVKNGHEGRISLYSAWDSEGFYDKLGFENGHDYIEMKESQLKSLKDKMKQYGNYSCNESICKEIAVLETQHATHVPCRRGGELYFTPTKENLAKLFAK